MRAKINNDAFENENELKNWLRFTCSPIRHREKGTKRYMNRQDIHIEDIGELVDMIKKIEETGFKAFKIKHLKGKNVRGSKVKDMFSNLTAKELSANIQKLVKYGIIKIKYKYTTGRRTIYGKNYENVDEAIEEILKHAQ